MTLQRRMVSTPRFEEAERMPPAGLRERFLVDGLFAAAAVRLVITDLDRMVLGGAVPEPDLPLPPCEDFGTRYFQERRETGIINIGAPGAVRVGAQTYPLDSLDCLYVGAGEEDVAFLSGPAGGAAFYFLSCPAHRKYPTALVARAETQAQSVGDESHASRRTIHKCIHPGGAASCQLVMGFTELAPSSVWNTMPAHRHARRSEIYLYFDLGDALVVHLMGRPEATRHLIVRDRQAALSPPWSIHAGAGTASYRFIWGMAGENQDFGDMDAVAPGHLL